MATNNNEGSESCAEVDPGDVEISAFDSIDVFKPKIYTKELGFGKRKSFLCFSEYQHSCVVCGSYFCLMLSLQLTYGVRYVCERDVSACHA